MVETQHPASVEKEQIPSFRFPRNEMLSAKAAIEARHILLEQALILGNKYRRKVKLVFVTMEGPKQVETTIWALTERNVILKGGRHVPKRCILEVSLY